MDAKYDLESVGRGYFLRFSGETPLLAVNCGVGSVQPSYLCVIRGLARHGFSADFGGCGACAGGCFGCLVGGFFVVVLVCFLGR